MPGWAVHTTDTVRCRRRCEAHSENLLSHARTFATPNRHTMTRACLYASLYHPFLRWGGCIVTCSGTRFDPPSAIPTLQSVAPIGRTLRDCLYQVEQTPHPRNQ